MKHDINVNKRSYSRHLVANVSTANTSLQDLRNLIKANIIDRDLHCWEKKTQNRNQELLLMIVRTYQILVTSSRNN